MHKYECKKVDKTTLKKVFQFYVYARLTFSKMNTCLAVLAPIGYYYDTNN